MASTISIQQKIFPEEVILKSEGVFEIENFRSEYKNPVEFAEEKVVEADISWFL